MPPSGFPLGALTSRSSFRQLTDAAGLHISLPSSLVGTKLAASLMAPLIDLHALRVERGTCTLLHDVDWCVSPGEHWVILGPNGCGKTTLLSILAGYSIPTAGDISVLGETFGESDWRELRRHIGVVSSNLRQRIEDPETALEVVASGKYAMLNFWGRLTRADRADAAAQLEQAGCPDLLLRRWGVLSQGERQRVLIARALISKPRLLILDEPCAGLDPVARERFLDFLTTLAAAPDCPALVLVTHHVEEILPLFTHGLLLSRGRRLAAGPLPRVLTSALLSQAFETPLRLSRRQGRHHLTLT